MVVFPVNSNMQSWLRSTCIEAERRKPSPYPPKKQQLWVGLFNLQPSGIFSIVICKMLCVTGKDIRVMTVSPKLKITKQTDSQRELGCLLYLTYTTITCFKTLLFIHQGFCGKCLLYLCSFKA